MNLTANWITFQLKSQTYYFVREPNSKPFVAYLDADHNFIGRDKEYEPGIDVLEVLAPCDYEELKRLQTEVCRRHLFYKDGLNDGLTDAAYFEEQNKKLRNLLKDCRNIVAHDCWQEAQFPDGQIVKREDILTRINAAITTK